jgi:hypothetical protein
VRFAVVLLAVAAGCGGSKAAQSDPAAPASSATSADPASSAAAADAPPPQAATAAKLPTDCADKSSDTCTPPGDFVERLCARPHQDLALLLFGKTPFTRLYLRGKMDELSFDEEVLALRFHAQPKGGIQVGNGNGTYDVLRWDGSCSRAVEADMITKNRPPKPKTARVLWHRLDDKTQTALIVASDPVKQAHSRRGKECKGAMSGDVSAACEKADATLGGAIVEYVRGGGSLPEPAAP